MFNRFSTVSVLAIALLVSPSAAFAQCEPGETVIKIGGYFDADHFARHRATTLLRDTVDKELQGKACLEYVTNEAKYTGTVGVTAVQSGDINLLASGFSTLGEFLPEYRVFGLPFAFRNLASVESFQSTALPEFTKILTPRDLQPLSFWHKGFDQIAAGKPAASASKIAGMKFRRDVSREFATMLSTLNAVSISVSENDLDVALKEKRVDGVTAGWQALQVQKIASVLGHVNESNHRFAGYHVLTQKSWWEKLDPALQKSLSEIITRVSRQVNFETVSRNQGFRRSLMRSGVKVWALTAQQRATWLATASGEYRSLFTPQRSALKSLLDDANSGL